MNSLQGTRRSDLNDEQWKVNDKRQAILEYVTYRPLALFGDELSIEEFYCPMRYDQTFIDRRTCEACESMVLNTGCSKIKDCEEYVKQKKFQELFPSINWNFPEKTKDKETLSKVNLIKKGAIILPKQGDEL